MFLKRKIQMRIVHKKMKNKVIIFDCDGTLVDTFLLIEKTVFQTFETLLPDYPLTKDEAHQFFGPFLNDSFKKYVKTDKEVKQLVECYRCINDEFMPYYIKAYDGIKELLESLKKKYYTLAIVSNKVTPAVLKGLKLCQINDYFDLIIGAEQLKEAKPNPDGIYQVLKKYPSDEVFMIGDTIIDIETGKNANVKTIGVTWCKTSKEEFIKNGANFVVDKPQEILKIVSE